MKKIIRVAFFIGAFIMFTNLYAQPSKKILNVIVIGAHPDDCDLRAGGTAALFAGLGHHVKFVSLTNGDKGHQVMGGGQLARRRFIESKEAAKRLGIEYDVLDNHDGELMPTLENRMQVIRLIREWKSDIVISCRSYDYHPDHRNTGLLVQDAAYLVIVPNILSSVEPLQKNPLFLYTRDGFQRPYPFRPDIVIDIAPVYDTKVHALDAHVSQYYEWLPWTENQLQDVPKDSLARKAWLAERATENLDPAKIAAIDKWYGKGASARINNIESFEICEYGLQPTDDDIRILFPMLPQNNSGIYQPGSSQDWISLFDGKSLKGWHGYNKKGKINNWKVEDNSLICLGKISGVDYGGDLVSDDIFGNFELAWEWRVDAGANSGLMYHVEESASFKAPYETGPEYQILDDAAYSDVDKNQLAGSNYGMYPAIATKELKPLGQWNTSRLIYNKGHVEHWLNGLKVVEFDENSDEWKNLKDAGKWKSFPGYGKFKKGKFCLQDHGHKAYYRNIRVRKL